MTDIKRLVNTNIDFVSSAPAFSQKDLKLLNATYTTNSGVTIPEFFDWINITFADSAEIAAKKKLITRPPNQHLCGSCWAISTANCISDRFVVAGVVKWNPDVSTTYALANYPQGKCNGGSPAKLLYDIAQGGIPSNHCIDYSWCSQNKTCTTGDSSNHFGKNLSALVPNAGCYSDALSYMYYIDRASIRTLVVGNNYGLLDVPQRQKLVPQGAVDISNIQRTIQQEIIVNGPVVAGFLIFDNFVARASIFTKINGGVYLEKANYHQYDGKTLTFSSANTDTESIIGGHAICVIGWGIAKKIRVGNNDNDITDVPYWYCRNSWGPDWGEKGFFKVAMFPFNRKVQFSKVVKTESGSLGGVLTFAVSGYPKLQKFGSTNYADKRERSTEYYATNEDVLRALTSNYLQKEDSLEYVIYVIMLIIIVSLAWLWHISR